MSMKGFIVCNVRFYFRAIKKTFDLNSDDELELVDRISNEKLGLMKLHSLPPNSHIVSRLILKHTVSDQ